MYHRPSPIAIRLEDNGLWKKLAPNRQNLVASSVWSSGMIPALGAGFKSRNGPCFGWDTLYCTLLHGSDLARGFCLTNLAYHILGFVLAVPDLDIPKVILKKMLNFYLIGCMVHSRSVACCIRNQCLDAIAILL
jgi:hypothetical protein